MAFFDDKNWLLDHIRNSFITSDDTGMCEMVMLNNDFPIPKNDTSITGIGFFYGCNGEDDEDHQLTHNSPDIISDMDFQPRRRSNTAIKLDKMKQERQEAGKIRSVPWRHNPKPLTEEELDDLFGKKEIKKNPSKRSLLSEELKQLSSKPINPFSDFARFDASAQVGIPMKQFRIFLTMLPEDERSFPLTIAVLSSAKVRDVIGLVLYKYTNENDIGDLKTCCDEYNLYIAEDNGEVDWDFPCLEATESISKFDFELYALVEKKESTVKKLYSPVVFVNMPDGSVKKYSMETTEIKMKEIFSRVVKDTSSGEEYYLAKEGELENRIDGNKTLDEVGAFKLALVKSKDGTEGSLSSRQPDWETSQRYRVTKLGRITSKFDYLLDVCSDKMYFIPADKSNLLNKGKAYSHDVESIGACYMVDERPIGKKATFRLVTTSKQQHKWKSKEYETDLSSGREIVAKLTSILQHNPTDTRKQYLAYKEKNYKSHT